MKRNRGIAIGVMLALLTAGGCVRDPAASAPVAQSARFSEVRSKVQANMAAGRYPGAVFAVARGGDVLDIQAVGVSNLETSAKMRTDSIFRTMSMTKPVTAVAAMILVEEGKLDLDGPVSLVLPEFAKWGVAGAPPLTLRHLLTHTSGIGFGSMPSQPSTLKGRVEETAARQMTSPVGKEWAYSGVEGPDIVARMIEVVAGEPYDRFVERRILDPLEMKDTGYHLNAEQRSRLVALHAAADGKVALAPPLIPDFTYPSGGAGLYTTAPDYLRFAQMLAGYGVFRGVRLLKPASVAELRREQVPAGSPGLAPGVGYSFMMRRIADPIAAKSPLPAGAYGWSGAYGTHFWVDPNTGLTAVWMVNLTTAGGAGSPDARAFEEFVIDACSVDRRCGG